MKLRMVDPRSVVIPEVRVTSYFPEDLVQEFRATVATMGVLAPPICVEDGDRLVVVDGRNRLEAAIVEGLPRIQVAVREGSLTDAMVYNLVTATMHGKPKLGEVVRVIAELHHTQGVPTEDLAKRTGLPIRYIDDLLIIWEGGPSLMMAVDEGAVGKGHALLLAEVKDAQVRDRLLMAQVSYRYSIPQLQEVIAATIAAQAASVVAQPPELVEPPPPVLCHFCKAPLRPQELRAFSMCPACLAVATEYGHSRLEPPAGGGGP